MVSLAALLLLHLVPASVVAFDSMPPTGDVGGFGPNSGVENPPGWGETEDTDEGIDREADARREAEETGAQEKALAHKKGDGSTLRPALSAALTPDKFDSWLEAAIATKKTAFVRWMHKGDHSKNCTWIATGYTGPPNADGGDGPMMPHMMEEGEVIDLDAKPPPPPPYEMTDHCAVVKAQEEAWLAVLEEYKDSDVAIFGDVIVDDWPETLKKLEDFENGKYSDEAPEPKGAPAKADDPWAANGKRIGQANKDKKKSKKEKEAELIYFAQELQKLKGHGCTVRHYSAQQAVEHLWIPHCADLGALTTPHPDIDEESGEETVYPETTGMQIHVKDVLNSFKWYIHEDDQEEHSEPEDDEADTPTNEELGLQSDEDAEAEEQEEQEEHGEEAPDEAEGEEGQDEEGYEEPADDGLSGYHSGDELR